MDASTALGSVAIATTDGRVGTLDLARGATNYAADRPCAGVAQVVLSPNASRVASFCSEQSQNPKIWVWDRTRNESILKNNAALNIAGLAWSDDNESIAITGSNTEIRFADINSVETNSKLEGNSGWCTALAVPRGKGVIIAGCQSGHGGFGTDIRCWSLTTGRLLYAVPGIAPGGPLTVDSPNNVLLSSAVGSAQLWDLASGSVRCTVVFGDVVSRELIAPASFTFADQIDISPSAKLFAIMRVDGRTTVYDERDCSVLDQFDPPVPPGRLASITAIALNQRGELAAALLDDSLIGIQNVRTKQAFPSQQVFPTRTVPITKRIDELAWACSGSCLIGMTYEGFIYSWLSSEWSWKSPDKLQHMSIDQKGGRIAALTSGGLIYFLDVKTGQTLGQPLNPDGIVTSVRWSGDGRLVTVQTRLAARRRANASSSPNLGRKPQG